MTAGAADIVVVDSVLGVAALVAEELETDLVATSLVADEPRAVDRRLELAGAATGARGVDATICETRDVRLAGAGVDASRALVLSDALDRLTGESMAAAGAGGVAITAVGGTGTVDDIAGDDIAALSAVVGTGMGAMTDGLVVDVGACNAFVAPGMTCSGSISTNVPAASAATPMIIAVPNRDDGRDDVD